MMRLGWGSGAVRRRRSGGIVGRRRGSREGGEGYQFWSVFERRRMMMDVNERYGC